MARPMTRRRARLAIVGAAALLVFLLLAVVGLAALALAPPRLLARIGYDLPGTRQVTGILVTGTPKRPVIYVTSSDPRIGGGALGGDLDLDTNSGVVSRLTSTSDGWKRLDLVRGLPRSEENHATNGLALDERTRTLYVAQGSNTNMGAPSHHFAFTPEYALSGAILSVDLDRIGERVYDLPTLDDETRSGRKDDGDPFGGNDGRNQARLVAGGPVEVYAPGFRNPYDLLLTEQGRLYTIQNGAGKGWGDLPAKEGPAGRCTNAVNEPGTRDVDTLELVRRGRYAGHPNPTRANPRNTFNADGQSPVERARPVECDYRAPRDRGALAFFELSTNGLDEYTASNFGGALRGDLLAASFDNTVYRVRARGAAPWTPRRLFNLELPLDLTAQADDEPFRGTVWVAEYDDFTVFAKVGRNVVVYEPADFEAGRSWSALARPGRRRQEVSFVRVDGRFYLAGGAREHEAYDPARDTWERVAPLPRNLDHVQGVELGGRIYYVGGLAAWPEPHADSVYVYDPQADAFSRGARMPRGRGAGGVAAYEGRIYYAGGLHDGKAVRWFDAYDPETDRWTRLPDMPRARDHFQGVVAGGKLYAIGGRDGELGKEIATTDVFDFATGRWSSDAAPIPTLRGGYAAAVVGDEVLVIGGEDAERAHSAVEAYDTQRDTWRALDPMPTPRHGIQAIVCKGAVYVAAGGTAPGSAPSDANEVYRLDRGRGCGRRPAASGESGIRFRKRIVHGTSSDNPTSLQFGPDGRLYVAEQYGLIRAYTVVRRTNGRYEVTATEKIDEIQRIPNHDDDGSSVRDLESIVRAARERLGI